MGGVFTKVSSFQEYYVSGKKKKTTTGSTSAFTGYYKADVEKRVHNQDTIKSKLILNFHRKMFRVLLEAIVLR